MHTHTKVRKTLFNAVKTEHDATAPGHNETESEIQTHTHAFDSARLFMLLPHFVLYLA